jgi:hypothetical protein
VFYGLANLQLSSAMSAALSYALFAIILCLPQLMTFSRSLRERLNQVRGAEWSAIFFEAEQLQISTMPHQRPARATGRYT